MTPSITAPLFTDASAGVSVAEDEAPLSLRVFTSFEDAREIAPEWDRLVERLDGSLYMRSRWCEIWWRHYGRGRELRLCAVRAGDELVGMLPFCIDRLWIPVGGTRVAKLVGADSTVSLVELPLEPGFAEQALTLSLERLLAGDRVDMVHLGPCSAATPQLAAVPGAVASLGGVAEDEAPLSLRVFTSFQDAREIAPEWDRLVERLDGSLYMTSRWCAIC